MTDETKPEGEHEPDGGRPPPRRGAIIVGLWGTFAAVRALRAEEDAWPAEGVTPAFNVIVPPSFVVSS